MDEVAGQKLVCASRPLDHYIFFLLVEKNPHFTTQSSGDENLVKYTKSWHYICLATFKSFFFSFVYI